jgi:hypothetical protein
MDAGRVKRNERERCSFRMADNPGATSIMDPETFFRTGVLDLSEMDWSHRFYGRLRLTS